LNFDPRVFHSKEHFHLIQSWFRKRNFPCPELEFLPPTGCIVYAGTEPVACGFLFCTDARLAGIGHLVTNPEANKDVRQPALENCIRVLESLARIRGFGRVSISSNIEKLNARFEAMGFEKCDEDISIFRRFLCR
jgi:hypothetical protein